MREAIVFVPGLMSDTRIFTPQINELSRDYPVHIASHNAGESIREMAQIVLETTPETFALVGHSMGGIVAMEMLRQAPDRVTRVALLSTTPLGETPAQAAWREPQIVRAKAGYLEDALSAAMSQENLAPTPGRQDALRLIRQMGMDIGAEVFVRQSRALQRRRDAQSVLIKTKATALLLCGSYDRLTPVKRHEAMAELIAHSELVVLENAGHLPTLESPEATNQALRTWLERPLMLR